MMDEAARKNGDVIRRVSKATAFLQAFAMLLMVGLIYLLSGIYGKYEALQDGVRENALWSVYQLDREARRLHEVADIMAATGDLSAPSIKALSTRYDILYSRMAILKRAKFDLRLDESPELKALVEEIEPIVMSKAPWFDAVAKGQDIDLDHLREFAKDLDPLAGDTEKLLTEINNKVSAERADARDDLEVLQIRSGVVTALLAISVGVLVITLRRQLRSVRSAALAFETIASELKEAYASAEAGNRAKSQFMATMGHEVRTPLNAVLGTAELLELDDPPEQVRAGIQTIRRSGQSLLEILNEILDFAKMENGEIDVSLAPTDIKALVASTVEMMRDRAAEHGDTLISEIDDGLNSETILTDATRVRQVVLNLLSNAIKFTSDGAVVLKMNAGESDGRPVLRFAVSDTGIGIDREGQEKLFKPFSQVDSTISRKYGGTGLGLTICKEIVVALGGSIGVASRKGEGSTFWFEIPAEPAEPASKPTNCTSAAARGPRPKHKILLVEDNVVNQQVAVGFLRHLGQDVTIANDGLEALDAVAKQSFDLVLMDMQMPNMDGIEATRHIRAMGGHFRGMPIVAMTANASDDDRRLCVEAGMTAFQSKPVTLSQLAGVLDCLSPDGAAGAAGGEAPASERPSANQRQQEIIDVLGQETFDELLSTFFADAAAILSNLPQAMRGDDAKMLDRLLHSMKGAAGNVGLQDIADIAQALRQKPLSEDGLLELLRAVDEQRRAYAA
ncbi:response regulator [Rhizobium sp. P38BS-XIX]|uniref:ATP-binding protein n=1 Tax=Rhizobium sp. P38BS-XIX TaxID=2726740 RepID=UPI0014578941|nr:ATP-binding protein [Rhizobium sp. P38BS-XIX]NLR97110.1 response regulator [Rhizobium sp. P38BS-XIX]